jgi:membrane protease YdiL (CAAX protease family)
MTTTDLYADRRANERRTWTVAILALIVAFFLVGGLSGLAVIQILKAFHLYPTTEWAKTDIAEIVIFGSATGVVALWVMVFERRRLSGLGFNGQPLMRLARGAGIGLGCLSLVIVLISLLGGYRIAAAGVLQSGAWTALLPITALMAGTFVQSSFEEVVMRGWLMAIVASRHGLISGIVVSTVVFTLLHAVNVKPSPELVLGLINVCLAGTFLALYASWERSLWGVCAWHAGWNWFLGTGFALKVSGATPGVRPLIAGLEPAPGAAWWLTGGDFGPEASLATTVVLTALILILVPRCWPMLTGATNATDLPVNHQPIKNGTRP